MRKRKIPVRKHRGVKDPEKQAEARFSLIKDKINNPPTDEDNVFIPRKLRELKESIERLKNPKPKQIKKRSDGLIDTSIFTKKEFHLPGMKRKEKPVPIFKQMPGENPKDFLSRINRKCQEVIHETKFEEKFDVEVQRNKETGNIEAVKALSHDETNYLKNITPSKKTKKVDAKIAEKKKKRLQKFKEKKQAKKHREVDEFTRYKDEVQFGEIVHEPPKLSVLPRRAEMVDMPGKRDLLLKGMLPSAEERTKVSVFDMKVKSDIGKVGKKKKNEKSPAEQRRLEKQRLAAVQAYRDLKARNQAKNRVA
ncbi:coiled-coil domain-containing protein 137 [Cloeon dipterum]|uniref:coiled-coil domain-containing protein 137 n=1 Tax=Cloeon dipterum TaxID=197152 RepID=UPI00322025F7